jgi:hypothetical protein
MSSALVAPAASLQVQAVAAVEFDAFLFQQVSLENVAESQPAPAK